MTMRPLADILSEVLADLDADTDALAGTVFDYGVDSALAGLATRGIRDGERSGMRLPQVTVSDREGSAAGKVVDLAAERLKRASKDMGTVYRAMPISLIDAE